MSQGTAPALVVPGSPGTRSLPPLWAGSSQRQTPSSTEELGFGYSLPGAADTFQSEFNPSVLRNVWGFN